MDDEFLITIKIAERHVFQLRIKRAEEEIMRKAASEIERKIRQYRQRFSAEAKLDTDDLLAMVAFQLSLTNLQLENLHDTTPITEKVRQLTNELEDYLKG